MDWHGMKPIWTSLNETRVRGEACDGADIYRD